MAGVATYTVFMPAFKTVVVSALTTHTKVSAKLTSLGVPAPVSHIASTLVVAPFTVAAARGLDVSAQRMFNSLKSRL